MKKICLYVIILVVITFIIPVFFTRINIENVALAKNEDVQDIT